MSIKTNSNDPLAPYLLSEMIADEFETLFIDLFSKDLSNIVFSEDRLLYI